MINRLIFSSRKALFISRSQNILQAIQILTIDMLGKEVCLLERVYFISWNCILKENRDCDFLFPHKKCLLSVESFSFFTVKLNPQNPQIFHFWNATAVLAVGSVIQIPYSPVLISVLGSPSSFCDPVCTAALKLSWWLPDHNVRLLCSVPPGGPQKG